MPISTYIVPSSRLVHETKVDFSYRSVNRTIHVVQYDKQLPIIAVTLYVSGKLYTLPATMDVNVKFGKRDRTFIYKPVLGCNADRTVVYFEMDEQMTFIYGLVSPILELSFVDGGNVQRAGSSPIAIEIERNPIQESDVQSTSEYIDLTKAVADVQQAVQDAEEIFSGGNYFKKAEINSMLDNKVDKDDQLIIGDLATQAGRGDFVKIAYNHSQTTHAPSNAQKNSDITKVEIEEKLTGQITSHSHDNVYYKKSEVYSKTEIDQSIDGVTILLNEEGKLKISENLEIDGGFL